MADKQEPTELISRDFAVDNNGQLMFAECADLMKKDKYWRDPTVPAFVGKLNSMIRRMGSTTLLGEQAMFMALQKVKRRHRVDIKNTALKTYYDRLREQAGIDMSEGLIATFTSTELKKLFNIRTSNYAQKMEELMNQKVFTKSWWIVFEDKNVITESAFVVGTVYDKNTGKVSIKFNEDASGMIENIKTNGGYTMFNTEILRKLQKDLVTWQFYQQLRMEISYQEYALKKRGLPEQKEYAVDFSFAELKFLTTINNVNLWSDDPVQKCCVALLKEGSFEEAEEILPDNQKGYEDFRIFKKKVLTRACKMINGWDGSSGFYKEYGDEYEEYERLCGEYHCTDIHFRYIPLDYGNRKGNKTSKIRFYIRWDKEWKPENYLVDPKTGEKIPVKVTEENVEDKPKLPKPENKPEQKPAAARKAPSAEAKTQIDAAAQLQFITEMSEIISDPLTVKELQRVAEASGYDMEKVRLAYMDIKQSTAEITADNIISAILGEAVEGDNKGSNHIDYDFYMENFPGFKRDELKSMVEESRRHMPCPYRDDHDLWIADYITYYRDKIRANGNTRTTLYTRLMDSLRKDYDKQAEKINLDKGEIILTYDGKTRAKQNTKRQPMMEHEYTDSEYLDFERKKLGIK